MFDKRVMKKTRRLLVFGILGRAPIAGVAWQILQYLEGLRRLGHDVYYIEDTLDWHYDQEQNTITSDPSFTVRYVSRLMSMIKMQDHWAYISAPAGGRAFGLPLARVSELLGSSDGLLNLTGSTLLREEHLTVPIRIYVETDPVLRQIEVTQGRQVTIDLLAAHTHHFTFGENFGAPDCRVPIDRFQYRPTRQPVVLDWWKVDGVDDSSCYTTIANWKQSGKDIKWKGEIYTWSKHHEFVKFLNFPDRVSRTCELAIACGEPDAIEVLRDARLLLTRHRWRVADGFALSKDILPYREYIMKSRAEFTVAKDQNIRLRSGWFSDRSACYLAASRPVITQDTAFGNILPTGEGLFAFKTLDDAVVAVEKIESDYVRHSRAAHDIAQQYFRAEKVLADLLSQAEL